MSAAELTDDQVRQQVIPALRKLNGAATLGDIVASAGTPARRTADLLNRMLVQWGGTLAVDDKGELLYRFPPNLSPPYNWQETWNAIGRAAYTAFKVLFKICIAVVLVFYFFVFLFIMLAIIIIAIAAALKDGDGPSFDLDFGGGSSNSSSGSWDIFWIFSSSSPSPPATTIPSGSFQRNKGISAYQAPAVRKTPLYGRVFNFVFGEEAPPIDPAAGDRELLAFIRERKGVLTASDLVLLRGGRYDEAERLAARLLVDYSGEPEVSDNGTVIYRFTQVVKSADQDEAALRGTRPWRYWWEAPEPPAELTGNGTGTNVTITTFNSFNLAWSGYFLTPNGATSVAHALNMATVPVGAGAVLGGFPFLFSTVFFAVPAVRWYFLQQENERRTLRNSQRGLMKKIADVAQQGQDTVPPALGIPHKELQEAVIVWQGDAQIGENGQMIYRFERLKRELADAAAAQQTVNAADLKLGEIVYDTRKDLAEQ